MEPTVDRDSYIKLLQDKIALKKVEIELQELNTKFAKLKAEELNAVEFIASRTQQPQNVEYELTQEDLDENPELVEQGYKVGDKVVIGADTANSRSKQKSADKDNKEQPTPTKGLKKV